MTRTEILLQRREFLVKQYEEYRDKVFTSRKLDEMAQAEQSCQILFEKITEVDNLLLKEVSK